MTKRYILEFVIYTVMDVRDGRTQKVYVRHGNYSKTVGRGLKVLVVIDAYYGAKRENKILLTEINYVGLN